MKKLVFLFSFFVVFCLPLSGFSEVIAKLPKLTIESHNEILSCLVKEGTDFLPESRNFEPTNAYAMALFSFLAYSDQEVADQTVRSLGFTKVKFIQAKKKEWKTLPDKRKIRILADTEAVWAENDQFIVLAFQGTVLKSPLSIFTDLMTKRVPMGKMGKVHSGFYGAVKVAWPQIVELMKEVKTPKPIFLTGHSLGAALAILTSVKILQHEERDLNRGGAYLQGLYTFGAPKVGDKEFRDKVEKLFDETHGESFSVRFVHNNDVVPHLPLFSLHQLQDLKYFDSHGHEFQGDEAVRKSHHSFFKRYVSNYGIGDHDMRYYLQDTHLNAKGYLSDCFEMSTP